MMTLCFALCTGAGLWLLYDALVTPAQSRPRPSPWWRRRDWFVQADLPELTVARLVGWMASGAILLGLAAQALAAGLVPILAGVGLGAAAPLLYVRRRREARRAAVAEALVEALAQVRDSIRAGYALETALGRLAEHGPPVLRPEFRRLEADLEFVGLDRALVGVRERLADPVLDQAVLAWRINGRLGGRQVGAVMERVVQAARAEERVRAELRAQQARMVLSGQIVLAVPPLLVVLLQAVNPDYHRAYSGAAGQVVLAVAALVLAAGGIGLARLLRLPAGGRIAPPNREEAA